MNSSILFDKKSSKTRSNELDNSNLMLGFTISVKNLMIEVRIFFRFGKLFSDKYIT